MKIISMKELKERGLKKGDIYYWESGHSDFTTHDGWRLVITDNYNIGLNCETIGSWELNKDEAVNNISKIIFTEDIEKMKLTYKISTFMRTFDEYYVSDLITEVTNRNMATYIKAVHFGNSKPYKWMVPRDLESSIKAGQVVNVYTKYGIQLVEVQDVYRDVYSDKFKQVIEIVKHS